MNSSLTKLLADAEGRYLTNEESRSILEYSTSLPARLEALKKIESIEEKLVTETVNYAFNQHPSMKQIPESYEKGLRDVTLVLRYCAQAMIRNDMRFLEDKLLFWLKTMFKSFSFEANFVKDTYIKLDQLCRKYLDEKEYQLLSPYIQECINVLG